METWGSNKIYGKLGTERPLVTDPTAPAIRPGKLDLKDYSGPLQPRLSVLDLSKELLIKMVMRLGPIDWGLIDGQWGNRVTEMWGSRVACALDDKLWDNMAKCLYIYSSETLNYQGTAVEKALKCYQSNVVAGFMTDCEVELLTPNLGILTINRCNTLDYFEKRGEFLRLIDVCWKVDPPCFEAIGTCFDPDMKCVSLKLPPQKSKDDVACAWGFYLGEIKTGDIHGYVERRNKAAQEEGVPTDLNDYSGPLHRRIGPENFSKEALAKILAQESRMYQIENGQWHSLVKEAYGDEAAWERQERVWEDHVPFNARFFSKTLNVQGSPVEKAIKCLQLNPAFGLINDLECKLENPNLGVVTCYRCATRDYFERLGGEVNMSRICGDMEQRIWQKWAQYFHPNIEVKPVKLPPKDERHGSQVMAQFVPKRAEGEIVCQWEFKLKE